MNLFFIVSAFISRQLAPGKTVFSNLANKGQCILALFFFGSMICATNASATNHQKVAGNFSYELITSDVFPWIDGSREGTIDDGSGKMATKLKALLKATKKSVDAAIYGVDHQPWLLDTWKAMIGKKMAVRFVVDQLQGERNDWIPENFIYHDTALLPKYVQAKNIRIDVGPSGRARSSNMHNKFLVFDQKKVWLGSVNMSRTEVGSEYNANTVLVVNSPEIASIYSTEFKQMYEDERFSRKKIVTARKPLLYADGTEVSVFFSPEDDAKDAAILPFIKEAKKTINIGMFYLTDETIVRELAEASEKRDVKVRIITDALAARSSASSALIKWMREHEIEVRIETWGGKMHMKTASADGKNVIMGSMNWSVNGEQDNDENTVWVRNNAKLATKLDEYFERLWDSINMDVDASRIFAEGTSSVNSCFDGLDNDYDGKVDTEDTGCE